MKFFSNRNKKMLAATVRLNNKKISTKEQKQLVNQKLCKHWIRKVYEIN